MPFQRCFLSFSDGNLKQILLAVLCFLMKFHIFPRKKIISSSLGRGILNMKFLSLLSCGTSHVLLERSTPTEHVFCSAMD